MQPERNYKLAFVLLAAGLSGRFGQASDHKLLFKYAGKPLLAHTLDRLAPVIEEKDKLFIVTGHRSSEVAKLAKTRLEASNINWQESYCPDYPRGMGHSLACGANAVLGDEQEYDALMLLLADHPAIESADYRRMINIYSGDPKTNKQIVTSTFDHQSGPPVIFPKTYWASLLTLKGDQGARSVVKAAKNRGQLRTVNLPMAAFDIDTKSALAKLPLDQ